MFRRILVAWDGSDPATRAFEVAADLASLYHADLHVVSVIVDLEDGETHKDRQEAQARAEQRLAERQTPLHQIASAKHVEMTFHAVPARHPADAIVDYAHEHGFDLVVMGRRGMALARVERFLLGSTADKVSRYARCDVLLVSPSV